MTANTTFRVTELDFDQIKNNLKDYLRSQSTFQDYDFDGAGMNILLDVLAYNTHYMGFYLNQVASEMFLDTAVIRDSVVSRAKELGYVPSSKRAAVANVALLVTPPNDNTTSTLTLPKYTQFQSEAVDGTNYTFVNLTSLTASKNLTSNNFTFSGVNLYQGEPLTTSFTVDTTNPQSRYVIPNANIDTTTLIVSVQQSVVNTVTDVYTVNDDMTALTGNSKVFFLEAINDNQYAIYFGDGYIGKRLSNGNIILTEYIATDGQASNKANTFTALAAIYGFSNVTVTSISPASGGSDAETIEQIKFRAPLFYTSQNRSVTLNDYHRNLLDNYPNVDQISVWGGEDNDPVVYGKVFISMKPKDGFVITNTEKQRIIDEIIAEQAIVSITPEIVDPVYVYVMLNVNVYYDPSATTLEADELKALVRTNILSYADANLGKFNTPLRQSKIQTLIDATENSILNSDVSIRLQKRFTPTANSSKNYTVNFSTPINRGGPQDKLYTYPVIVMSDSTGVSREAYIEEVPFSYTGIEEIDVINAGSGYTSDPTVTITGDGTGATASAVVVNGRIESITVTSRGTDYSIAYVTITGGGGTGAVASPILSAKFGTLRVFYYSDLGEKVIINDAIGTINYTTGTIQLTSFEPLYIKPNPFYDTGVLTMVVEPELTTISPLRNNILTIDSSDSLSIQITTIPVV